MLSLSLPSYTFPSQTIPPYSPSPQQQNTSSRASFSTSTSSSSPSFSSQFLQSRSLCPKDSNPGKLLGSFSSIESSSLGRFRPREKPITRSPNLSVRSAIGPSASATSSSAPRSAGSGPRGPLLVTVLGKGGSGKTTAAVLLAKYYAAAGKKTCLLLQSQDRHAETLLGCTVSSTDMTAVPSGIEPSNLCAIRLDTTKVLLEPLEIVKEVDQRLGLSQGALAQVVGEELSVLPGMDPFAAIASIELLAKPGGGLLDALTRRRRGKPRVPGGTLLTSFPWGEADADVIVFDGPSSSDVLRLLGSPERGRWYLRRFREVAESTDAGRVALPTVARAIESELNLPSSGGGGASATSAEVWQKLDDVISKAVDNIMNPSRVKVFLVCSQNDKPSILAAKRLWGCTYQAGSTVSGLLFHGQSRDAASAGPSAELAESFKGLPALALPEFRDAESAADISRDDVAAAAVLLSTQDAAARKPVEIDLASATVSIFLPGLEKSEVKLKQWKGGSELLVEAGDQRRCIDLPKQIARKIAGAKFVDGCLQVKTR